MMKEKEMRSIKDRYLHLLITSFQKTFQTLLLLNRLLIRSLAICTHQILQCNSQWSFVPMNCGKTWTLWLPRHKSIFAVQYVSSMEMQSNRNRPQALPVNLAAHGDAMMQHMLMEKLVTSTCIDVILS